MVMERLMRKFHTNPTPKKKYSLSSNPAACTVTFGQPLRDIVQRDKSDIPLVVQDIFDFLLTNHGLEAQGIFRVNGNSRTVEMLRNLMDETGAHWRVSDLSMIAYESERSMDVFSVASLLKLYLRELPDSLVPAKMTSLFLEAYRNNRNDKSTCFSQLEQLITQLPVPNYTLLQHLCHFLSKVWNCRAENKMSGESLGIVFGPSVFHIGQDSEDIYEHNVVNRIMTLLIENASHFFRMNASSCANVTQPSFPTELFASDKANTRRGSEGPTRPILEANGTQSNSSGSESLSNSTTLGLPKSSQPKLHPTGSTDNDITGTSILQSPTTWQTEDLSAGLAAAIRVCIEEHVFGPMEPFSNIQACVAPDSVVDKHANLCTNSQPTFSPSYEARTLPSRGRPNYEPQADFLDAKTSSTLDNRDTFGHRRSPVPKSLNSTAPDALLQLTQRLHLIKSQVRDYERNFEAIWGRKPNFMEKRAESRVRKLLDELTEIRTQIKQTRIVMAETVEDPQSPTHDAVEHEVDHLYAISSTPDPTDETPIPRSDVQGIHDSGKKYRQLNGTSQLNEGPAQGSATLTSLQGASSVWDPNHWSSGYNTTNTGMLAHTLPSLNNAPSAAHSHKASNPARSSEASLTETYELLIHRLAEKRASAKRPEDLTLMNPKQIESEKLAIQKALLYFESLHGRPRTREERLIMRPIYDRYRAVKRLLSATTQDERPSTANPPTEGQISGSDTRATDVDSDFCNRGTHIISSELDEVESITRTSFRRPTSAHPHLHMDTRTCLSTQPPHRVGTASTYSMSRRQSQPGINSGDDESPSLIRQSQQQFSWNTRVSTIPRSVQLTEEVELQSPPPDSTGRNEWFGSFRPSNRCGSKGDNHLSRSSTCVPSVTVTSEENTRPSPSREFPSSTPLLRTTSVSTSTRAKDELDGLVSDKPDVKFTRSEPPLMSQQKSFHDIRAVSSPSEFVSTNTASESQNAGPGEFSRWTLTQLQDELQSVQESKRHLQKILKDFEHEFLQATGHKVERNDRLCMRAEYAQYKVLKIRLHQLETELESRTG
ncbi:protein FAM13A [Clonorchis sinensis]|uniref:Protein FAM13A n=1 Tax=Clonorchis sinensis TaxID=79923 RepID=H2KQ10_CLOSI|nr:protein FAM13A [Clonorchis sinensis]